MSIRLLVVDDAPFIHEILRNLFAPTEIEVVGEAYNGQEAIDQAKALKPDVILMDIVLPKKSGLDATEEILQIFPDTSIIACSSVTNENLVARALDKGCCHFINKPFSGQELIQVIKNSQVFGQTAPVAGA